MWVGWFQSSLWGNISLLWAQHPHRRPSDSPVSSPVVWATDPHGESGKPETPVVVTGRVRMCDGVVCMNSFFGGGRCFEFAPTAILLFYYTSKIDMGVFFSKNRRPKLYDNEPDW